MIEIERKFLVTSDAFKKESFKDTCVRQGFLNTHPERTVRVRIMDNKAFLTVKGKSNALGTIRTEWEMEILVVDADQLLKLCEEGIIEKRRYEIKKGDHIFEVDEFFGNNEGLTIAEIELNHEEESFEKPEWLGQEVTGELKYYNSFLSKEPYKDWDR